MLQHRKARLLAAATVVSLVALLATGLVFAAPLGTSFTYQGQLRQAGAAVNGTCDFQFSLFDAASGGAQVGVTQAASGLTLVDGRFTVQLDFGGAAFDGNARWLEIATRCPAGGGGFTTMAPRQPLSPSPYALFAGSATSASSFSGNLAGDVTGSQGSTVVARLQGRNVVNTAPADGAVLRYNGTLSQWEPVVPVDAHGVDYAFVYSTQTQALPMGGTFLNLELETTGTLNGWTINGSSTILTVPTAGVYLIQYEATPFIAGGGIIAFKVASNGTDIPGSRAQTELPAATTRHLSKAFLASLAAGDTVSLLGGGSAAGSAVNATAFGTPVTASLTITRVN